MGLCGTRGLPLDNETMRPTEMCLQESSILIAQEGRVSGLLGSLVQKPQRETAGSSSALRFDYQKNWAFCEMLHRHLAGSDYLVAFEFHDDVAFFDAEQNPTSVEFVQVKTQDSAKPRTTASIVARGRAAKGKTPKNSIIGKMCLNFSGIASSLSVEVSLVTNNGFEFSSADVLLTDVALAHRKRIVAALAAELPSLSAHHHARVRFRVAGVAIDKMETYAQGVALSIFKKEFGVHGPTSVLSWMWLVQSEITRKNGVNSATIASVQQLILDKCIGRSFVQSSLHLVKDDAATRIDFEGVRNELLACGWKHQDIARVQKRMSGALADFKDPGNWDCQQLVQAIGRILDGLDLDNVTLADVITSVKLGTGKTPIQTRVGDDEWSLSALVILVRHERL